MRTSTILLGITLVSASWASDPEENLKKLGLSLPKTPAEIANYVHAVRVDDLLYLSGKGPLLPTQKYMEGKLGKELTTKDGQEASKITALNLLGAIKAELGDLSQVQRIIKVTAAVNSTAEFTEHSKVLDGASDLLTTVFGEAKGKHARTVFGVNSLPMNIPIEIDMLVKVKRK